MAIVRIENQAPQPKWLVEVVADRAALDDLELINSGAMFFDVPGDWANRPGTRCICMAAPDTPNLEAHETAQSAVKLEVEELNRQLACDSPLHPPIEVASWVWKRNPESTRGYSSICCVSLLVEAHAQVTCSAITLSHGVEIHPPRTLGLRERALMERSQDFRTARTIYAAAGEDIRQLWLPFEYAKKRSGHTNLAPESEVKSFKITANNGRNVRHIGEQWSSKVPQMTGADARAFVGRVLRAWVDKDEPT